MNRRALCIVFAGICAIAAVMFLAMNKRGMFSDSKKVKVEVKTDKEAILDFMEEKGVETDTVSKFALKMLPDIVNVYAMVEFTSNNYNPIKVSELGINGYMVPEEVLSDICEKFLDFKCSLVYN